MNHLFLFQYNVAKSFGYWLGERAVDLLFIGLIVGIIVFFVKRGKKNN